MYSDIFVIFITVVALFIAAYAGRSLYVASCSTNDQFPPVKNPIPSLARDNIFGVACMECGKEIDWTFHGPTVAELEGSCECKVWQVDPETYIPYWNRKSECEK